MTIDFDGIRDRHALLDVAARYVPSLKKQGKEYVGQCPFHNDSDPSLTIYRGRDAVQRYRCFPCGVGGDVIDFMAAIEGVDAAEACRRLEGNALPAPGAFVPRELPPDESECWTPIIPVPSDAPKYNPGKTFNPRSPTRDDGSVRLVHYRPERLDEVRGPGGELYGYVARLVFDDGKKICPVITFCEGPDGVRRWCTRRFARPTPLVGLDELAKRPNDMVLVVSGEKCRAVAAEKLPGFVVVTWIGGDPGIEHADLEPLRGRALTLWPDADASGIAAMKRLQDRLAPAPAAA
jgi:putative DNA primase/helicase